MTLQLTQFGLNSDNVCLNCGTIITPRFYVISNDNNGDYPWVFCDTEEEAIALAKQDFEEIGPEAEGFFAVAVYAGNEDSGPQTQFDPIWYKSQEA